MLNKDQNIRVTASADDEIELNEFEAPQDSQHHDQFGQYTHRLSDDAAEASTRVLVRLVPLAYGALLGGLAGDMLLGLSAGLALCIAFDLYMGRRSLVRSLFGSVWRRS